MVVLVALVIGGLLAGLRPGDELPVLEEPQAGRADVRDRDSLVDRFCRHAVPLVGIRVPEHEPRVAGEGEPSILDPAVVRRVHAYIDRRERPGIEAVEIAGVQQLGLHRAVRQGEGHGEGDVLIRQGVGELRGEALPLREDALRRPDLSAALGGEGGGHALLIALGHGVDREEDAAPLPGAEVIAPDLGAGLRQQGVLPVQDVLDLGGDAVDLLADTPLDLGDLAVEVQEALVHPVHCALPEPPGAEEGQGGGPGAGPLLPALPAGPGGEVAIHDLLHHLELPLRELGALRGGGGLRGVLHPQKPPHRHAEAPGEGHQLLDLREPAVGFPLINCLPGDPQLASQSLLGEAQGLPFFRDALSRGHWQRLLSWAYPARLPPAFPAICRRKRQTWGLHPAVLGALGAVFGPQSPR